MAILGAGFAGLASAFFLSDDFEVSLFDKEGIGKGASGASCGLLHPYPGEKGRKSWHAEEAMQESLSLLWVAEKELEKKVASYNGILREGPCLNPGTDVDILGENLYLIRSGVTVFVPLYLEGLWKACEKKEVRLYLKKIEALEELAGFDCVVLAAGFGIKEFIEPKELGINFVKGQALICQNREGLEKSVSRKHYTAITEEREIVHVGATYEREEINEIPCVEKAIQLLSPSQKVLGVKAGVRVTNRAHYFPLLHKLDKKTWVFTALGSRGLLYHAYMAKKLKNEIMTCSS